MRNATQTVLSFPCASGSAGRRQLQKRLSRALRTSDFPVVIDLSECRILDHQDIDILLDCVAESVGRDIEIVFVAGSPTIRVLLEVTRIASIVRVFDSMEQAISYPPLGTVESMRPISLQLRRSA